MKTIATHERRTFLKDHPPVMQRMLLHSTGVEQDLIAGTVLGEKDGKCGEFTSGAEALGILVEDTTIPAAGDVYALVYVHASVITAELTWGTGVTATEQKTALAALRGRGIYASEA